MDNQKPIEITEEIKKRVLAKVYEKDGKQYISLDNCRLDFSNKYQFLGFTKKGIKLAENYGAGQIINRLGKVFESFGSLKLVTEGWQYIEKI